MTLLQRKTSKHGAGLGKTTGWIHRASLRMKDVTFIGGVNYERIGDEGLMISEGEGRENPRWLDVDHVVLCAGQDPLRELVEPLEAEGVTVHWSAVPKRRLNWTPSGRSTRLRAWQR